MCKFHVALFTCACNYYVIVVYNSIYCIITFNYAVTSNHPLPSS